MYYLKKINKGNSNLYINVRKLLEVDLDNEIREQVNDMREEGIIKDDKKRMLKNIKTNEKYEKEYKWYEDSDEEDDINDDKWYGNDDDYDDSDSDYEENEYELN